MSRGLERSDLLPHRARRTRKRDGARRAVCLAVIGVGIALVVLTWPLERQSSAANATPRVSTALFSPRRVPQSVTEAAAAPRLAARINEAIAGSDASCVLVHAPGLGTVADIRSTRPLAGASTQKILTALAALTVLGPEFRYETKIVADSPNANGVVAQATLLGGGDPVLATAEYRTHIEETPLLRGRASTALESLADQLTQRSVKSIGVLVVDDSRYDSVRFLPTWRANYATEGQAGGLGALVVNDGYSAWKPDRTPARDPALDAGQAFAALLRARGVPVTEVRRTPNPPSGAALVAVQSPPLRDIAASMLRSSNNTTAELITRELAVAKGQPGTTPEGVTVITETMQQMGVPMGGVTLLDGSGLTRDNQVTCAALLGALQAGQGPTALHDLLAVAGTSGTLAKRFSGTPLAGALYAKTGTLNGITGLTGYVETYRSLSFALIANSGVSDDGAAFALQSRVANALRSFPGDLRLDLPTPSAPCTAGPCR
ncbi:MAG: D-alanyl-D-alanine carboxypeptidase/D-alanyl-D-alanine endopeptidase [Acidimicrobiia bacterium]